MGEIPGKNILKLIFYINVNIVDAKCQVQHSRDMSSNIRIFDILKHLEVTTKYFHSPRGHDKEVHEVPGISHVTSLVEHEAQSEYLGAHLRGEDHHEDDL